MEARIIGDEKFFRLESVNLRYHLKIPHGKRPETDRALEIHERYCPVHQSIKRGFEVTWSAAIDESQLGSGAEI